jgi:hypothetical protein
VGPDDLRYFPGQQDGEHHVQHVAAQKKIDNKEQRKKKNPAANTAPPADPRFKPFYDFAYEAYRVKHGQPPTWNGKDQKRLQIFLAEQAQVTAPEFQRRFTSYLDSTEDFTRKQGSSLAYFLARFDSFSQGPIHATRLTEANAGQGGGKNESFSERRRRESVEAIRAIRRNFDTLDDDVGGYVSEPSRN